jgi:hypothetical protein
MTRGRKNTYFDTFPEPPEFLTTDEDKIHFSLFVMGIDTFAVKPIRIFYSYSPNDAPQQMRLERHLSVLYRRGIAFSWPNDAILPGVDWKQEVEEHLNTADIILLLIGVCGW